jgi:hypothetical protein
MNGLGHGAAVEQVEQFPHDEHRDRHGARLGFLGALSEFSRAHRVSLTVWLFLAVEQALYQMPPRSREGQNMVIIDRTMSCAQEAGTIARLKRGDNMSRERTDCRDRQLSKKVHRLTITCRIRLLIEVTLHAG